MKNLKTIVLAAVVVAGLIFTSCEKDDDNNPNGKIILKINTTSSSSGNLKSAAAANDLVFNSGTITIREVVFDGKLGATSVSRTKEQIADIYYATGAVSPAIDIEVPAGNYTGVNLWIELQDDGSDPSVVIEGTYTNSSEEIIPIRFEFNSGEVFEANASSVTIEAGSDLVGKITFDAISWFSTVSADALDNAKLTNGKIVISETSNSDIFDIAADRLDIETQAVFE